MGHMAAYDAVVSLLQDLECAIKFFQPHPADFGFIDDLHSPLSLGDIQHQDPRRDSVLKAEIGILYQNTCILDSLLRDSSSEKNYNHELTHRFGNMIIDIAIRAGNCVDSHLSKVVLLLVSQSNRSERRIVPEQDEAWYVLLGQVTTDVSNFNLRTEIKFENTGAQLGILFLPSTSKLRPSVQVINRLQIQDGKLVGCEKEFVALLYSVLLQSSALKVIAVTGVCGIGKTIRARQLYDHPLITEHFHVRVWINLSEHYFVRGISGSFFGGTGHGCHEEIRQTLSTLFKGKKYLIVLDDLQDNKDLSDWMAAFPDEQTGSRILLTSRLQVVHIHNNLEVYHFRLSCLSPNESWELFCSKMFPNNSCPVELETVGKEIANNCQGVPLVILVIARFLLKLKMKPEVWAGVAKGIRLLVIDNLWHRPDVFERTRYMQCIESLKRCFHHLELFPEFYGLDERMALEEAPRMTLQQIIAEMCYINIELKNIYHGQVLDKVAQNMKTSSSGNSNAILHTSRLSPKLSDNYEGLEYELKEVLDFLTGVECRLRVFSITGMAGIGKTTFARKLYEHPLVIHHFYTCAWVTMSQEHQLKKKILDLLSYVMHILDDMNEWSCGELEELLYKSLKGRRYLIVLDDIWDNKVWDDLRRAFPDDNNGSRIMLTSRHEDVCIHASPNVPPFSLRYLNHDESWKLFSSTIFGNECVPSELIPVGNDITQKCCGLALAIVVVGGLLSKMNKTLTVWKEVAEDVSTLVMEDPLHCQNILALSYNHLLDPLKACFLYFGVFPKDYEIHAKKLIYLWIAEGFISPNKETKLEELAESYLEDLVARNLIMVKRRRLNGRIKTCFIHDIMREFCLREAKKENFLHVIDGYRHECQVNQLSLRRVSFLSGIRDYMRNTVSFSFSGSRSLFCFESLGPTDLKGCWGMCSRSLRVLDVIHIQVEHLSWGLSWLTHLKYVALSIQFPKSDWSLGLENLQNLQTLIVTFKWNCHLFKINLWDMLELRHLCFKGGFPSLPYDSVVLGPRVDMSNFQTLSTIRPTDCKKEVFSSMPNLKKLSIYETEKDYKFHGWPKNIVYLKELETLKFAFFNPFVSPKFKERHPTWGNFPPTLLKLTLSGTSLPWVDMLHLSKLPKLEVLKLKNYAFSGPVWEVEDGFLTLKFLLIGSTDLKQWEIDRYHFPRLQHLVLRHCRSLIEIPYGIRDLPMLEMIELYCCSDSAAISARKVQEEQRDLGNDDLTVLITERKRSF